MPLPSVLTTYGWCRVTYVLLQSLASHGVAVHVTDASRLAMCRFSRRCASFTRVGSPYRDPGAFVEDLVRAMKRTGARVLIPGHEDVLTIARWRHLFPSDVLLPFPEAPAIERTINKWGIIGAARAAGIPFPATVRPGSAAALRTLADEFRYPAVVKPQRGNSGKGVSVVNTPAECVEHFERLVRTFRLEVANWPIIQEFLPGAPYGVCLLYNRGSFRAAFCERYLRCKDGDFGTSVLRESVRVPALEAQAKALLDSIGWHGVAHLDFLYDEATGRATIIEMNPRFWGALDLAVRAGVDFPWLLYRMAVDGDVAPVEDYRVGVRSRWILGEMIHLVNASRRLRIRRIATTVADLAARRAQGCDDFRWDDPLPLLFECSYYATRFLATGSTNPVDEGMFG